MRNIRMKGSMVLMLLAGLTALAAPRPQTVVPVRRDEWWMARHEAKLQEVRENKNKIDLVLIGDSITHFMDDRAPGIVQQTFPDVTSLNLGFSADKTENVLWRLQQGEIDGLSPKLVVIMIGTNNTGHRKDPADVTVQGIRLIIEEVLRRMPGTKVLLLSIFPRGETPQDGLRQLNEEINRQLPSLADNKNIFHRNINQKFLDAEGRLSKEIMPDFLHPSAAGYKIWMDAVKPTVERLLKSQSGLPTPPEVWKNYDPDAGDFKEEIILEETKGGIYYKDSYISAYINGEEVRVYCKYAVKAGAKKAPGLMNVHGWMSGPAIDMAYVNDGWAVMSHDYSGISQGRPHHTAYPEALGYGNMDAGKKGFKLIYSTMPDGRQLTDPKATSHYLWNAVQRRALSYLLAQKEVDPERIGAKGYSYGGTIMWNLAMDSRVKATVAYFGIGWLEYFRNKQVWMYNDPYRAPEMTPGEKLYLSAIAPQAHAPYIRAACLWLNGSNDHHGGHERGEQIFKMFAPGIPWDFAIQARGHHNTEKLGDDCKLWLEKYVLGKDIDWPARPKSVVTLNADGVPEYRVTPASPKKVETVQIYYALKSPNNIARSWRDAETVRQGNVWVAEMPVLNVDDYVFGFSSIKYAGNIVISSDFEGVIPSQLGPAVATDKKSDMISEGTGLWSDVAPAEGVGGIQGFRALNRNHGTTSEQFNDPKWKAPNNAQLVFKFYCTQPQSLVLVVNGRNQADIEITASDEWQTMVVPADRVMSQPDKRPMDDWSNTQSIQIKPQAGSDITQVIFAQFKWVVPEKKEPVADQDGRIYLTKAMASQTDSFWRVMEDKAVEGKIISIGGKKYDRGLGVHAASEITFPLDGKYSTFHVVPGPDDANGGQIEMKILVDGKEVFASGKTSSRDGTPRQPLDIPVTGAKTLTLIVTDGDGDRGGDHASWGAAYLTQE